MVKVIGVRFRRVGKIYYFDPLDMDIKQGDHVIVETARGVEYGYVVLGIREVAEDKVILPVPCENSRPSWFGFLITVKEGIDRKAVVEYVESHGVQTRNLFAGNLIKHPCFDEMRATGEGYRVVGGLETTDRIMRDTFWVGVYPGMTDEMIDYMAKTIKEAVNQ